LISRLAIVLCCFALLSNQLGAAGIMVNEYRNGSGSTGPGTKMAREEYIEFVITEETTSASLAALTFGDSNDATSMLQGVFSFDKTALDQALGNAGLTEFLAGTLLVVKGINLGTQNLGYDPLNGNWSIELVAGQGARDHSESLINGSISIGNNGDVVWVSTSSPPTRNSDTSGMVHAIGHENAPGLIANTVAAAFGSENVLNAIIATGRSIANVGDTTESLQVTTTGTMGQANGGTNSTWIAGLRGEGLVAAPEPVRAIFLGFGLTTLIFQRHRKGGSHV
jgi:hypothetical protein